MQNKLIHIWAWISVIMPVMVGLMFLFNPMQAMPEGTTLVDMARVVGLKNLVFSGLLAYAIISKNKQFLIGALYARGIGDILDGGTGLAAGFMVVPYYMALLTGIITVVAAFFLSKTKVVSDKV